MKVFHVLFLFTIAASQLGLAKSDDALNKDPALLMKPENTERALGYYSSSKSAKSKSLKSSKSHKSGKSSKSHKSGKSSKSHKSGKSKSGKSHHMSSSMSSSMSYSRRGLRSN
eukprot:CAMPEP_0201689146 /NCGR_PEP_ID=MMETSP0578-20130828/2774_1 /ASSEMBLY_ACC=CAM_ASM_000663 /TAXON_ID=267565 /ORGANISM="Skeletonema grethea, Strain CCMP 1804" /LENGTH=112 /DNA_ID=CAMNT_0048173679 /DNA_START=58 /DNA_END=396 /DNA_ORIENTATION=+